MSSLSFLRTGLQNIIRRSKKLLEHLGKSDKNYQHGTTISDEVKREIGTEAYLRGELRFEEQIPYPLTFQ